jgi:hypothetical protein
VLCSEHLLSVLGWNWGWACEQLELLLVGVKLSNVFFAFCAPGVNLESKLFWTVCLNNSVPRLTIDLIKLNLEFDEDDADEVEDIVMIDAVLLTSSSRLLLNDSLMALLLLPLAALLMYWWKAWLGPARSIFLLWCLCYYFGNSLSVVYWFTYSIIEESAIEK